MSMYYKPFSSRLSRIPSDCISFCDFPNKVVSYYNYIKTWILFSFDSLRFIFLFVNWKNKSSSSSCIIMKFFEPESSISRSESWRFLLDDFGAWWQDQRRNESVKWFLKKGERSKKRIGNQFRVSRAWTSARGSSPWFHLSSIDSPHLHFPFPKNPTIFQL